MDTELTTEQLQDIWNEEAHTREADEPSPNLDAVAPVGSEVTDSVATEEQPPVEPEPNAEPEAVDPFDSLPEAVRAKLAEIDQIKEANAQLLHHVKTAEGRVAAMQREFEQARKAQQNVAPNDAPSQQAIASAAANPEKWEQLKQDFPEWAGAMEDYVSAKLSAVQVPQGLTAEEVANFVRQQVDATKADIGRQLQEAKIEGKYDNWRDIVNTTEFAAWFAVQKADVKALADSANAKDAIQMLDMFHEAKAKPAVAIKQERGARLAAAAAPTKGSIAPPPKSVDDMTATELWNFEAAKRAKQLAERGF